MLPVHSVWLYRYHGWGSVVQVVALYNGGPAGAIYELFVHFPIISEGCSANHAPVLLYHASTCSSLLLLPSWHQPCRRPAAVRHQNLTRNMSIVLLTIFYSISLGINHGRALWKDLRLVCWLVEFPGVGCWHCVNVVHSGKPDCFNVCRIPSGFGGTKVARLRELPNLHMDLLRHRLACQ